MCLNLMAINKLKVIKIYSVKKAIKFNPYEF